MLLFAISFSLAHDCTFITLKKDHHFGVESALDKFAASDSNKDKLIDDIHAKYHAMDIGLTKIPSFADTKKIKSIFKLNETLLSYKSFNFFKPPIV